LNRRWNLQWSTPAWNKFWTDLWAGTVHLRTKFVVWRITQNGFFPNSRGAVWGVCTNRCPICNNAIETTAHLFFECVEVRHRWVKAIRILRTSKMAFGRIVSAFDIVGVAVQMHVDNPALLILVAELGWCAWVERNLRVFQGNVSRLPLQVVFRNRAVKLEALETATEKRRWLAVLKENRQFLLSCAQAMSTGFDIDDRGSMVS
jgi:hypothetical protein